VLTFTLDASPFMLDPVNVTATRTPMLGTASLPAAALTREELRREAGVSLAHALDDLPGVRTVSTGEQVGKPVIRGVFGSRVLVLEDALRLEDYSWSDEDAPSIDARFADRVEVVRGPASILYGSDALGGVVNVVPAPVPQPGSGVSRRGVELSLSSNRREAGIVGRAEGATAALGWRALVVGHFAEDFHTPVGPVENTGYGALNGELAVGTQKRWGTLTARYARYAGEFKLLEAEGPPSGLQQEEEGGPERKLADDRLQVIGAFPIGSARLETRAQFQRHWRLAGCAEERLTRGTAGRA
jgi:outer membrane cobalamin receptor